MNDLQERLINFAVRIIRVSGVLPKTEAGTHIAKQILHSGLAPAPMYQAHDSTAVTTCLQNLYETQVWLRIIHKSEMLPDHVLNDIMAECEQLCQLIKLDNENPNFYK